MIVDDERLILNGVAEVVRWRWPHAQIQTFVNPLVALQRIRASAPDFLLTDIYMPRMEGLELIRHAKELGVRHCAILTGYDDFSLAKQGIRLQVLDYLLKPVDKDELYGLIEKVFQQKPGLGTGKDAAQRYRETQGDVGETAAALWEAVRQNQDSVREIARVLDEFATGAGLDAEFWTLVGWAVQMQRRDVGEEALRGLIETLPAHMEVRSKLIAELLHDLETHLSDKITMHEAARRCHLEPTYFSTLFRTETGVSFIQYLNRRRVEAACRILFSEPDSSMEQVAVRCGLSNVRYFFRTFKKHTGLTPGEFKHALGNIG